MILTAKQISHFDEIRFDRKAIDHCLERALTHFENRSNELDKAHKAWWEEVAKIHGLNLSSKVYEIAKCNGAMVIREGDKHGKV